MNVQELLTKWGFEVDEKPLQRLEHRLEQVKGRLEFLAAAEVVKGIFELTERFSHFAESLGTSATSAGLTVEQLQRLQFAASQAGVGAEEVTSGMARLTRALFEARQGSAQAKEMFAAAGIPEDQLATFGTGADALAALADRMQGMSDPVEKQALAMQMLGRSSHNMVELLSEGSEGLKRMGSSADAIGAVVSTRDIHALREMEDAMSGLGQMVRAFSAHLAAMFAPAVREAVHHLQQFYAANRDIIEARLHDWALSTVYALGFVGGVVRGLAKDFFEFARGHQELFKRLGEFAIGYTAFEGISRFAQTFAPAVTLLRGAFTGLGWAAGKFATVLQAIVFKGAVLLESTLPALSSALLSFAGFLQASPLAAVSALVAAIGALVLIGEAAYTMLYKGGSFHDTWLGQLWEGMKGKAEWIGKKLGLHWFDEEDPLKNKAPGYGSAADVMGPASGVRNASQLAELAKNVPWYATQLSDAALIAHQEVPLSAGTGAAADPSGRWSPPSSQTFNVNLTVPPLAADQDPKAWGREVGAGVVEGVKNQVELKRAQAVVGPAGQDF